MAINKPFRRTCRPFIDGKYAGGWEYMYHKKFANSPDHFVRAFLLILKDLKDLFDFVEPSDVNETCYSFRIHSLILRTCVEFEANCKAILTENGYTKSKNMNIADYKKIDRTHRLSSYKVKIPNWRGHNNIRQPFLNWKINQELSWYKEYNETKHNRHREFEKANFKNLLDAVCGLLVILSSQFWTNDFSPGDELLTVSGPNNKDGMVSGIGQYFRVEFPSDWPDDDKYEFDWQTLKKEEDPFQNINYNNIA